MSVVDQPVRWAFVAEPISFFISLAFCTLFEVSSPARGLEPTPAPAPAPALAPARGLAATRRGRTASRWAAWAACHAELTLRHVL